MRHIFFFLLFILTIRSVFAQECEYTVEGHIYDIVTKEPLSFATVKIKNSDKGVVSNEDGFFRLTGICKDEVDLEVQFLGYKTMTHHHHFHYKSPIIFLAPESGLLESVTIEDSRLNEQISLSIKKSQVDKLSSVSTSISELTGAISGVSLLQTGSNVSKPMVHGLHSNRVLVVNDGIRHAYQVWGQEHAPEIDPSHVDQIEIVKGAGTVKYGPDALGGVILYNSKRLSFNKELYGSFGSSYQTNGRAFSSQLEIGQGFDRFAWEAGFFGTYQGDLKAPDYNLSNTGKRELGGSFSTLLHQPKFDLQVSGSYFKQQLGILRASIVGNLDDLQNAIDRGTPQPTFSETYKIQNPQQDTEHGLLKSNLELFLGDHSLNIQYAIQRNIRKEFDVRRGELNDRPVIDLQLFSHTVESEWVQPDRGRWSGSSGIQLFTQKSVNEPGSNPANFVPDYDVLNIGAFTIQSLDFEKSTFEIGARFDFQSLNVADTIRDSFIYSNTVNYSNGTFTLGFRKQLNKSLSLFSNIGSAWRPPNVAELYSFGFHFSRIQFGLWRYDLDPEIYTPVDSVFDESLRSVPAEKGFKWVSGIEVQKSKTTAEFIFFINQINDYIFLRPYGITVGVAGTFPFFIYDQTNALFLGSDWDIRINHSERFTSEAKVSYVYARETENQQALLEIPPLNIDYTVKYTMAEWAFGLNFKYTAQQWNAPEVIEPENFGSGDAEVNPNQIFDFMLPPDDYLLVGSKIKFNQKKWTAQFQVNNLLKSSYRVYTDRLRYFADSPGRNFSFTLQYKF